MDKGKTVLLFMLFTMLMGSMADEIGCPELSESPTFAEESRVWICQQEIWWKDVMEWKIIAENECLPNASDWDLLFPCPDFSEIQCQDELSIYNKTDQFGCTYVSCANGRYHDLDQQAFRTIWRKHVRAYKKLMTYYRENLVHCPKRGCIEPATTTTAQTHGTSTAEPMTTTMTKRQEIQTTMTTPNMISGSEDDEWTIFQRRYDGSVDFDRMWIEYVNGFGNSSGEFWLGLETIHELTKNGSSELRIDMITTDGDYIYAQYSYFEITSSADSYRLNASGYSGNATDALAEDAYYSSVLHQQFSARDMDNDNSDNCAAHWEGGWWFNACFSCHLNGRYGVTSGWRGIVWVNQVTRAPIHMQRTEMKIRPKYFDIRES